MTADRSARLPARRHLATLTLLALGLVATLVPRAAPALDLLQSFEAARQYDTQLNSSRLQLGTIRERLPQAQAGLRPALGAVAGAATGRVDTDVTSPRSFSNVNGGLNFSFPLYRPGNAVLIDQAEINVRLAEAQLALAEQDLVNRVATAYFNVLSGQDAVEVAEAQRRAIAEQFEAAKRNFEVGTATVTDQQEAQARLDLNAAQLAAAGNGLTVSRAALAQLTGLDPAGLNTLKLDAPLPTAEPNDIGSWTARARTGNFNVQQAELATAIAKKEIDRARYARQPVLDVVSQATLLSGKSATSVTSAADRNAVLSAGLQLSVPLYSGGALDARERETVAALQKAETDLENTRRLSEQGARQAFLGLKSSSEQARALEAAVKSSRLALDSNLLGYQVGVRINVDVLNAQQQLFSTLRDLARARYDVLLNALLLKATVAELQPADVAATNALLSPPIARTFTDLTAPVQAPGNTPQQAAPPGTNRPAAGRPGTTSVMPPVMPRDFGGRTTKPVAPGGPRPSGGAAAPR